MWFGTLIGAIIGYSAAGIFGALLGALAGSLFDKGLARNLSGPSAQQRQKIETVFFNSVFSIMGYLAKCDGRVSEEEIDQTEQLMTKMGLSSEHRREAIRLFKAGAAPEFSIEPVLVEFQQVCGAFANLKHMLLVYLVGVALADGVLHSAEERVLRQVAAAAGFSRSAFEQLISMIRAQDNFARGHAPIAGANELALAYQALGVESSASDKEVKRAYRRLMSEYHPDKLMGQGMPEDMVKVATERSQEVQAAYDVITKSRKRRAAA